MDESLLRILLVLVVVGGGLLLARLWPSGEGRRQGPVVVDSLGPWPAVLVFTSRDCESCRPVLDRVTEMAGALPVRPLAHQDDPGILRRAGVAAVPLVVVVDGGGRVVDQFPGMPGRRGLRRAIEGAA